MGILDQFKLDGKVALVTGASRGLGRAMSDPDGQDNFDEFHLTTVVSNGQLTIVQAAAGQNAKIQFIHILGEDSSSYDVLPLNFVEGWEDEGDEAGAKYGYAASAGDIDNDGYSDVIVGSPYHDGNGTDSGSAYVYYGSANGLSANPDWTVSGNQVQANLGFAVNSAGDVNGDGFDDVMIGSRGIGASQNHSGEVHIYYGSANRLSGTTPDVQLLGDQAKSVFGHAIASAGDVNGDGYGDIIVGAPGYDGMVNNVGKVFI